MENTDSQQKVPALSSLSGILIGGGLCQVISAWNGTISFWDGDLSSFKPLLFSGATSIAMLVAYLCKIIGYKYTLGKSYRNLSKINKKRVKKTLKAMKDPNVSEEKKADLKQQYDLLIQDEIDIDSVDYDLEKELYTNKRKGLNDHVIEGASANKEVVSAMDATNKGGT
ncbi:hypothetical protein [Vibrio cyclitrophicus]|uniref:hypothetical protein n=1 Tax=Vibrio cyclitrophicus TaxID=47951 RepID=UPI0002ECFE9B|nr:hypothetical protein [Vibrio cyclitrophicus]OEF49698.1 hypothetical protein OAC_00050 [Vibrio cyclitrophicus 1F273]